RVEAGAELEERGHPSPSFDVACRRREDAADELEQRRLPRSVGADEPERVGRVELEADVLQRPEVLDVGPTEADEALLERLVVVQAEALGDLRHADDGRHQSSWAKLPWARANTRCASQMSTSDARMT